MRKTPESFPAASSAVRLCWWCAHFQYDSGSPGYSEWTPGTDFRMECGKKVWEFKMFVDGQDAFAAKLSAAQWCKDFTPVKGTA